MNRTKRRQCGDKAQYATKAEAEVGMIAHIRRFGTAPGTLKVYRCPHCRLWHIGHVRPGRGRGR